MTDQHPGPAAFLSYARTDDASGQISALRKRLEREARMHLGEEFRIFQDWVDLGWGEDWRSQIFSALGRTTVLIAVLSPNYFKSANCRDELEAFLLRERELGVEGLVLPLYYVTIPRLKDPATLAANRLLEAIATRHWENWRELRLQRFDNPAVRQGIARLAEKLQGVVERLSAPEQEVRAEEAPRAPAESAPPPRRRSAAITEQPRGAPDPPLRGERLDSRQEPAARDKSVAPPPANTGSKRKSGPAVIHGIPSQLPRPAELSGRRVPVLASGAAGQTAVPTPEHRPRRGLPVGLWEAALGLTATIAVAAVVLILLMGYGDPAAAIHLWAVPPVGATPPCPRGSALPARLAVFYGPSLADAWELMGALSVAGILLVLLVCYALPGDSLGPRFVRRWYASLGIAMAFCFVAPAVVTAVVSVSAACNRSAFYLDTVRLPISLVLPRMLAGLVWGLGAFTLGSLLATRVLARGPFAGGFYHYRGCPWPRWRPLDN